MTEGSHDGEDLKRPNHIAIIMDGNGRWAQLRGHNRFFGHVRGAKVAKQTIESCKNLGIKTLTLFTFSTENWNRPAQEITFLMRLLRRHLQRERQMLVDNNIRFRTIGQIHRLPPAVIDELERTKQATEKNTGMDLVFAISYGGRLEIVQTAQRLADKVLSGQIKPEEINESLFKQNIESGFIADPDLIIRTSGEFRLSNFFLWQAAYSEIVITNKMWPDFNEDDLKKCIETFSMRDRRFGHVSSQHRLTTPNPMP